MDNARLAKAP